MSLPKGGALEALGQPTEAQLTIRLNTPRKPLNDPTSSSLLAGKASRRYFCMNRHYIDGQTLYFRA